MKRFKLVTVDIQSLIAALRKQSFSVPFSLRFFSIRSVVLLAVMVCSLCATAQQVDTAYQKVLAERTAKIVNTLGITNDALYKKVQQQLIEQYTQLNTIQDNSKAAVTAIKAKQQEKEVTDAAVKAEEEKKTTALKQLHEKFVAQLNTTLTVAQVEKVKDGMTYSILPVTWTAYLEMIPRLTQEQKDKMYAWLLEARELAMDEGSSDKKHAVFGKYKGRINNYLSAAGYDMKKEGEDWAKRIQAAKDAKQSQN
ncbi:DUF3826 domain-containing protein [Ferruginibacter profundus]